MGGREAEQLLLDDISIGSAGDLDRATEIARALVEDFGMGGADVGVVSFASKHDRNDGRRSGLSASHLEAIDKSISTLLHDAQKRAAMILSENKQIVELLRDELLEKKSLDAKSIGAFMSSRTGAPVRPAADHA